MADVSHHDAFASGGLAGLIMGIMLGSGGTALAIWLLGAC